MSNEERVGAKPQGYNLIVPEGSLLEGTMAYLKLSQKRSSRPTNVFIPTGLGVLISPNGEHEMFATYGAGVGNVYDLIPLQNPIFSAETADVHFCGVTKASFSGYKLLTHSGSPEAVRILTNRALDLAKGNGCTIDKPLQISVYCNPMEGYDIYVNGSRGYTAQIREMGDNLGIDLQVLQIPVGSMSVIAI